MASTPKKSTAKKTATKQGSKNTKTKEPKKMGRPLKEFDAKTFCDLVALGHTQEEIAWYFRDDTGKPANIDTLTRWCKRTFGMTFQEFYRQNGGMELKRKIRQFQLQLCETSASMAIWLGKNYLGQTDHIETKVEFESDGFIEALKGQASETFKNAGDVVET